MPKDAKYRRITVEIPPESVPATIPQEVWDNMPSVLLLAKDITSIDILHKALTVYKHHDVEEPQKELLIKTIEAFKNWQNANPEYIKVPDA